MSNEKYTKDWEAMAETFNVPVKRLLEMQMSFEEEILVKDITDKLIEDFKQEDEEDKDLDYSCLLYTSPSPRDGLLSRMPSSA